MLHFCCLLCGDEDVRLDDLAVGPTPHGNGICARCYYREAEAEIALDIQLRVSVRGVLRGVARDLGTPEARCVSCAAPIGFDALALLVHPAGWFCAACCESPLARALVADAHLAELLMGKQYRCILCEQGTDAYGHTLNPLGLAICKECQQTPVGKKLNQDDLFRARYLRALGLDKGYSAPSPSPLDSMTYGGDDVD